MIYHVSGWENLKFIIPGDIFSLLPGPQGAEGKGVYFSEGAPRHEAAEGAQKGFAITVTIPTPPAKGWYRTKTAHCKKHFRSRTWHTQGQNLWLKAIGVKSLEIIAEVIGFDQKGG